MADTVLYVAFLLFSTGFLAVVGARLLSTLRHRGTVEDFLQGGHTETDSLPPFERRVERLRIYAVLLSLVGMATAVLGVAYQAREISLRMILVGGITTFAGAGLNLVLAAVVGFATGRRQAKEARRAATRAPADEK